jgi:3-oxoacyl-[acyl-carrier protein] reductase
MNDRKVCIVTGGSSGIGLATVESFVRRGDTVIVVSRNHAMLDKIANRFGDNVFVVAADVGDVEQVQSAVMDVVNTFGRIDVLVNNAGTGDIPAISTETPLTEALQSWNEEIRVHLTGPFLMTMCVAPFMTRPGGRIIHVSSIAAFTGGRRPGAIGYASAKAGLIGLTYALARELSPQGITVNAVVPGFIEKTGFTGDWPAATIDAIVSQVPAGRGGTAADVASAIAYLTSEEASYITGQLFHVNGGWMFGR